MLYNSSGTTGSVWGGGSYNNGNYGNTTIGTSGFAGTALTGSGESINIENKAYNVVFYICSLNAIW